MKNKKFQLLLTIFIIIMLIGGAATLIKKKRAKLAKAPKYGLSPTIVHVANAKKGSLDIHINYVSVVKPFRKADISSRAAASVVEVNVDEGDIVKAGDLLVKLDAKDIYADIDAVSSQIDQAKAELSANKATVTALEKSASYWDRETKRDENLAKNGAIPESQAEGTANKADDIRGQRDASRKKTTALLRMVQSLEHKKAQLNAQLDYYKLLSPLSGVVTRRLVDPGDLAFPNKHLITVEDRNRLMLVFDVPQQDLDRVHEGLPVEYHIAEKNRRAKLSHLYPALADSRMVRAEVYLDDEEKTGLTTGAYIPLTVRISKLENTILVPMACLISPPDTKPYVYVVKNGRIKILQVKVLGNNGKYAAVDGIKPDEKVVINTFLGWAQLSDGMPVEVAK
ncbi:MAG: efflux RND transporter periplasmic adaptor subunit [Deltaproteobacteria bacterium]|nr:efflux RND transporter periplasmic adaptor subunit [Deltaproteobacteria bacterium]